MILGLVALISVLGALELSEPGKSALRAIHQTSDTIGWVSLGMLILLWPLSTVVTHVIARLRGLHVPLLRELRTTGKAWILHILTLIVTNAVVIALVSIGWRTLAEIWYISIRGGLLWVVFYPAAIESIYGSEARSCLMTFLTVLIVVLLFAVTTLVTWFLYRAVG